MKKVIRTTTIAVLLGLLATTVSVADTVLQISASTGPCFGGWQNDYAQWVPIANPPTVTGNFSLIGVSGSGSVHSAVPEYVDFTNPWSLQHSFYYLHNYTIDLSGMSSPMNHCIKLVVHFGTPVDCGNGPGVQGDPGQIQSATLAPFGDVTFVFNGGCLSPGQASVQFSMFSMSGAYKTGVVTVIDNYVDPASGLNKETRINVPALVPDVPPNPPPWVYLNPNNILPPWFQGHMIDVGTNQLGTNLPPANGAYDLSLQLVAFPTNGPALSQQVTQTVDVVNGLFRVPLPGELVSFADGSVRYLRIGVRPAGGSGGFTFLDPALPITPTPQALFAYSAGTVANLAPRQAVTSLNGLTDAVTLEATAGILMTTNRNTLTIGMIPAVVSDRNLKTDFRAVKPEDILARVTALPIEGWRYTNEPPNIRHVGPMAQDFRAAFGLGHDDKMIEFVDEQGVSLAAIQGLNRKVEDTSQRSADRIQKLETENTALRQALGELSQTVQELKHQMNGGEQ